MSVQAIVWAYAVEMPDPGTTTKAALRLALVTLANYADQEGRCWPKLARLERETCMSVRRLQRSFEVLEAAGLIEREARRRKNGSRTSNVYVLRMPQGVGVTPSREQQGVSVTPPEPSLDLEPSPTSERPLASVQKMGTTRKPDPTFNELAELHGGTANLPPPMAKTVGVALAAIRRATPRVSPEEIRRRAANYRRLSWNRDRQLPTAQALAKWWADCDMPGTPGVGETPRSRSIYDMTPEEIEEVGHGHVR